MIRKDVTFIVLCVRYNKAIINNSGNDKTLPEFIFLNQYGLTPIKIFPLQYYTQSGNLKPPVYFYIILLFLARTWVLLIISTASRSTGSSLLTLFYPDNRYFYLGLVSGFIALVLFLLSGRDHDKHPSLSKLWQFGYIFLLLNITIDFLLQVYFLTMHHFQYSIGASFQLVAIIWVFLYSIKSEHLKMCFKRKKFKP